MPVRILASTEDEKLYGRWVRSHPQGNLWQSLERKHYAEACGKTVRMYCAEENDAIVASALVVVDRTTGGFSTWDIPRGPLRSSGEWRVTFDQLIEQIIHDAQREKCIALYCSPMTTLSSARLPFNTSPRRIYAEATRILDLTKSDDEILSGMHPKGRYNIGVARKHGITVRKGSVKDIDAFYELLMSTGNRDGFKISQKSHYMRFLTDLDGSFILMADHEGKAVAGLIGVTSPPAPLRDRRGENIPVHEGRREQTGIYYYGASSYEHRQLMAPYLLQWEAMRYCKELGCTRYDLLGIAPEGAKSDDPWAGITDFKRKFGGKVVTYPAEQMIVLRPMMKKILEWKRRVVG